MNCKRLRDLNTHRRSPSAQETLAASPSVTVTLGDLVPCLTEAMRTQRMWVYDFFDEKITLSHDLYEVLQAFELNFGEHAKEVG